MHCHFVSSPTFWIIKKFFHEIFSKYISDSVDYDYPGIWCWKNIVGSDNSHPLSLFSHHFCWIMILSNKKFFSYQIPIWSWSISETYLCFYLLLFSRTNRLQYFLFRPGTNSFGSLLPGRIPMLQERNTELRSSEVNLRLSQNTSFKKYPFFILKRK